MYVFSTYIYTGVKKRKNLENSADSQVCFIYADRQMDGWKDGLK